MKNFLLNLSIFYFASILSSAKVDTSNGHLTKSNKVEQQTLHIGFFPNLTHPQALVGQALTHEGKGWFERYLPTNYSIKWHRFNAGPSAMESLITGSIDLSYVGPSPAVNLYIKTAGKDVRLLSGAIKGGSGLILQKDIFINNSKDWSGKKIATPQFGNTQDIACRTWFSKQSIKETKLLPTSNPDQLMLFQRKQIDGAWTIEPWLSRLINEGNGKLFFYDNQNWTTLLVGSQIFCEQHKDLKNSIIKAHEDLTNWIKNNLQEAARLIQSELQRQTRLQFPVDLIETTLKNLQLDTIVHTNEIQKWLDDAISIGFIKPEKRIPLDNFFSKTLISTRENNPPTEPASHSSTKTKTDTSKNPL